MGGAPRTGPSRIAQEARSRVGGWLGSRWWVIVAWRAAWTGRLRPGDRVVRVLGWRRALLDRSEGSRERVELRVARRTPGD